jgi:hypothetical protein
MSSSTSFATTTNNNNNDLLGGFYSTFDNRYVQQERLTELMEKVNKLVDDLPVVNNRMILIERKLNETKTELQKVVESNKESKKRSLNSEFRGKAKHQGYLMSMSAKKMCLDHNLQLKKLIDDGDIMFTGKDGSLTVWDVRRYFNVLESEEHKAKIARLVRERAQQQAATTEEETS